MKMKYGIPGRNIPDEVREAMISVEAYIGCAAMAATQEARTIDEFIALARGTYDLPSRAFDDPWSAIIETREEIKALPRKVRKACQKRFKAVKKVAGSTSAQVEAEPKYTAPALPKFTQGTRFAPAQDRAAFYQTWEWRSLRMEILKERGTACECCGATPRAKDKSGNPVRICVDHIKPVVRYWHLRLDKSNLQVLCDECNMGKGAWDESDWRRVSI